jgi:hypothetical protein
MKGEMQGDRGDIGHQRVEPAVADLGGLAAAGEFVSKEQIEKVAYACTHDTEGLITDDPTVGTCWDADRLTLHRCGIRTDPKFLLTREAKPIVDLAIKIEGR